MTAAPVRNLLFGALLLVCAWVPAATLAAPHSHAVARSVEEPASEAVHRVHRIDAVPAPAPDALRVRRT